MNTQNTRRTTADSESTESLDDFVDSLSATLDKFLFDPVYEQLRDQRPLAGILSEQLSDLKSFRKIDKRLRTVKVICSIFCLICFISSFRFFVFGYGLKGLIYLVVSLDVARTSANCYLKFYITQAVDRLSGLQEGGNISKISNTLFKMAKSAAGISGAEVRLF